MKSLQVIIPLIVLTGMLTALVCPAATKSVALDDPDGRAIIQGAQQIIAAYHTGQPKTNHVLRVVYFIPKNSDGLSNYVERIDRIINDVSDFYRNGLQRFGLETSGLPLERKDGKPVLHVVRGKLPAKEYSYDTGGVTKQETRLALKETIDFDREHVMIFYALSRKEEDGRYVFHSPYYGDGGSSHQHGLCHAADGELLDPLFLTETNHSMVFSEHYYEHRKLTVAAFNSLYLGGTAHELGHGLGLPHENGSPSEKPFGTSLMGVGNATYREELWGGKAPSYLGRASALLLASHPLFTGSDRGRWDEPKSGFQSLQFSANNRTLRIQGAVTSAIPAYAVVAYVWPTTAKTDHRAVAFPCAMKGATFDLNLDGLSSNVWRLKLSRFHVNGAAVSQEFRLRYDDSSAPDAADLNAQWIVGQAETAVMNRHPDVNEFVDDKALAAAPTLEARRRLRLLRTLLHPTTPFDLSTVQHDSAFLSDAIWTDAKVGWGQVTRNHYWYDQRIQNGVFLTLGGQFYDKGLYAHSASRYVFPVNGKWKTFTATIGLRDGAHSQGSAIFILRGDGRELYRSRILRVEQREEVKVDIAQVKELELLTDGGEGHKHSSWAIWAEPKVGR